MYKIPFLILVKRLQELNAPTKQIEEINWYAGQDRIKGGLRSDKSAFIRFLNTDTRDLGNGIQEAEIDFEILYFSTNVHKDPTRISATDHLDVVNLIYKQLHDFSADFNYYDSEVTPELDYTVLNTITRTGINTLHANRNIQGTIQRFRVYIEDRTAIEYYQKYTGDASIQVQEWVI